MRENRIDSVAPQLNAGTELAAKPPAAEAAEPRPDTHDKAAKPAAAKPGKHES
jgi:hypothetical protein